MRILVGICLMMLVVACGKPSLPHENKTVAQLIAMLNDAEPRTQAQGALGLSLHGPDAREAVPRLIELLDSSDELVRQQAALALGKIGPEAGKAVPILIRKLSHEDWALRRQAALALGNIGDRKASEPLERTRRDKNKLVQQAATQALEQLKKK
jgi:HEAT repeat protein